MSGTTPVKKASQKSSVASGMGCDGCPLDQVSGINKVIGEITGKSILVFAQSPGPEENEAGKELVGKSGKFFWGELKRIGLSREDVDIQNAVRCYPADFVKHSYVSGLKMRNPSAVEIKHCSFHTERLMQYCKATQILILGQVAAKALLHTKELPQHKIFWSDELKARIYLLDHPAFFLRGYGTEERLKAFRGILDQVKKDQQTDIAELSDHFSYIRRQDYRLVLTEEDALKADRTIRKFASVGHRISMDIENLSDGTIVCNGMSPKSGLSFVFVFHHRDQKQEDGYKVEEIANGIVSDPDIPKVMHYGCSDAEKYREKRITVGGYNADTMYSEYLRFSDRRKYGLDAIAARRFHRFAGYGDVVLREMLAVCEVPEKIRNGSTTEQWKWIENNKKFDIGALSLDTLRLYNGADADLTKRVDLSNKEIPANLLKLYTDLSFLLYRMEPNGPLFDYEQHGMLEVIYRARERRELTEIRELVNNPKFNPASPQQVYKIIYEQLELEYPFHKGKPDTRKATLLMLGKQHPFPLKQVAVRKTSKALSTYIVGYKTVADFNGGRLRTTWRATGTRTGRLSSGGDKGKAKTKVNLQNVAGEPQIQNMLVADKRWRTVYKAFAKIFKRLKHDVAACAEAMVEWVRTEMPDLRTFFILDYGQIEVRVAAQMANDKNLIEDCASGDIHTTVAVTMTGWDADRIRHDKPTRTLSKNCIAEGQRVLTDHGLIPIEKVQLHHRVWDGVEFVSHDGVICQGEREVVTHDGLTATPDHEVWLQTGEKVSLDYGNNSGLGLAITGIEEAPVRYPEDYFTDDSFEGQISDGLCGVSCVREDSRNSCVQSYTTQLYMSTLRQVRARSTCTCSLGALQSNAQEVYESKRSQLEELRRSRNSGSFCITRSFCEIHAEASTTSDLQRSGYRPDKQQWSLRTREFTLGDSCGELGQHEEKCVCCLRRQTDVLLCSSQDYKSKTSPAKMQCNNSRWMAVSGSFAERSDEAVTEPPTEKAKVYDILNAGPRHRYTVENKLVSNCHFGILFGIAKENLYDFVVAMSPPDMQGRITKEEIFAAYDRYFARYSGIARFIQRQRAFGQEHGYVTTLFGMKQALYYHQEVENNSSEDFYDDSEDDLTDADAVVKRGASPDNQAINGPVQGTAHQLLTCGLVNCYRKPNRYRILCTPVMDVHDALYFNVRLLDLPEASTKGKYLLEKESLATLRKDFPDIDWTVPIVTEAEAGLRLGCKVELEDGFSLGKFCFDWYVKCREQEKALMKDFRKAEEYSASIETQNQ